MNEQERENFDNIFLPKLKEMQELTEYEIADIFYSEGLKANMNNQYWKRKYVKEYQEKCNLEIKLGKLK